MNYFYNPWSIFVHVTIRDPYSLPLCVRVGSSSKVQSTHELFSVCYCYVSQGIVDTTSVHVFPYPCTLPMEKVCSTSSVSRRLLRSDLQLTLLLLLLVIVFLSHKIRPTVLSVTSVLFKFCTLLVVYTIVSTSNSMKLPSHNLLHSLSD